MRSFLLLLASLSLSASFRLPQHVERKVVSSSRHDDDQLQPLNRVIIASTLAILGFCGNHHLNLNPPPAYALQERNEVLCNTGFFTNVGAWYCTDIGNIGDEGTSKPLTKQDEVSVDSLMSKFNFEESSTASDSPSDNKVEKTESGKTDVSRGGEK